MEVTEHYVQLVRLLAHGKFTLYNECSKIIAGYGSPISRVYKRSLKIFFDILIRRYVCGKKASCLF